MARPNVLASKRSNMRHKMYKGAMQAIPTTSNPLTQGPFLIGAYLTYPAGVVSPLAMAVNRRWRADSNVSIIFKTLDTPPDYASITFRRNNAPDISLRQ